jgi:hypothetical protein
MRRVKDARVGELRYIVYLNEEQAALDRRAREAILVALEEQLRRGGGSLEGHKGYRRYVKTPSGGHFEVDESKVQEEARYDGARVLTTNLEMDAAEMALKYKEIWRVELEVGAQGGLRRNRTRCPDPPQPHRRGGRQGDPGRWPHSRPTVRFVEPTDQGWGQGRTGPTPSRSASVVQSLFIIPVTRGVASIPILQLFEMSQALRSDALPCRPPAFLIPAMPRQW